MDTRATFSARAEIISEDIEEVGTEDADAAREARMRYLHYPRVTPMDTSAAQEQARAVARMIRRRARRCQLWGDGPGAAHRWRPASRRLRPRLGGPRAAKPAYAGWYARSYALHRAPRSRRGPTSRRPHGNAFQARIHSPTASPATSTPPRHWLTHPRPRSATLAHVAERAHERHEVRQVLLGLRRGRLLQHEGVGEAVE